jgi:hypothetical protein
VRATRERKAAAQKGSARWNHKAGAQGGSAGRERKAGLQGGSARRERKAYKAITLCSSLLHSAIAIYIYRHRDSD